MNRKLAWKIYETACLLIIFCGLPVDAYLMGEAHTKQEDLATITKIYCHLAQNDKEICK